MYCPVPPSVLIEARCSRARQLRRRAEVFARADPETLGHLSGLMAESSRNQGRVHLIQRIMTCWSNAAPLNRLVSSAAVISRHYGSAAEIAPGTQNTRFLDYG